MLYIYEALRDIPWRDVVLLMALCISFVGLYVAKKGNYTPRIASYQDRINEVVLTYRSWARHFLYREPRPTDEEINAALLIERRHRRYPLITLLSLPNDLFSGRRNRAEQKMFEDAETLREVLFRIDASTRVVSERQWFESPSRVTGTGKSSTQVLLEGNIREVEDKLRSLETSHGRWSEMMIEDSLPYPRLVVRAFKRRFIRRALSSRKGN